MAYTHYSHLHLQLRITSSVLTHSEQNWRWCLPFHGMYPKMTLLDVAHWRGDSQPHTAVAESQLDLGKSYVVIQRALKLYIKSETSTYKVYWKNASNKLDHTPIHRKLYLGIPIVLWYVTTWEEWWATSNFIEESKNWNSMHTSKPFCFCISNSNCVCRVLANYCV